MPLEPVIQHWLVSVSRAAGLDGADELNVASDAEMSAVWDTVAMATGVTHSDLAELVASHYRLPIAELEAADEHARKLLSASVARKLNVFPVRYSDRALDVATADPVSMEAEREIMGIAGRSVHFEVAPPADIAAAIEAGYPRAEGLEHEVPPLTPDAKGGPHVLVVDDDEQIRSLFRRVLEDSGFRVSEATDGPEALELLARGDRIELVTLDLKMDKMEGLEVLRRIRSRLATATLPVVVATGSDDPAVEMQLFEAGADDFVVKPVDPPRFLLRIRAVLRRRQSGSLHGLL